MSSPRRTEKRTNERTTEDNRPYQFNTYRLVISHSYLHHYIMLPKRKSLPHGIPSWVSDGSEYFITICAEPRGTNQLCQPKTAEVVHNAFHFYQDRGDLWVHLLLLMPDHLHAIVSFSRDPGMQKSIHEIKKYTARNHGIKWQRDFFDHRLRHDESYIEKAHYIRMNPVRAGLVDSPEDWPYIWENRSW